MFKLIRNEWQLFSFGFLMTFWSAPGQTFLISLFSGEIRAELNLTDGEFATIFSAATLASAFCLVWSGSLIDKIGLRKLTTAVIIGLATGCLFISFSDSVFTLLISLFLLLQFGQGLIYTISSTAVVRYLDTHKGKSIALAGMGYTVGEALLPSILVALLVWVGWRSSWLFIGLALVLIMIPATWILLAKHKRRHQAYLDDLAAESTKDGRVYRRRQWTRAEVIRDKWFYLFLLGLMSQPLMFTGFIFHQIHLVESKQWSLTA